MRMREHGVPEDDAALGTELFEDAVDDRPRRLLPRSRAAARAAEWIAPASEVVLAGEGDARPAHALVAGRFADRHHVGGGAFLQVVAKLLPQLRREFAIDLVVANGRMRPEVSA